MITNHAGVLYFGYACIGFNKTALVLRLTHLNWQSPWWNKFHLFHIYFMLIGWSRANIFMWDVNYSDKLRQRTLCSTQMTPWWLLDNLFHVFDHFRPPRLKTPLAEPQNRKCRSKYCTYDKLHDVSFQKHPKLSPNSSWAPRSRLSKIFFFVPQKKYPRRIRPRPLKQTVMKNIVWARR